MIKINFRYHLKKQKFALKCLPEAELEVLLLRSSEGQPRNSPKSCFLASIDHPGPPESSLVHGEYYVILISEMGAQ